MKGFTISGPDGPIISVAHTHGEIFSALAAFKSVPLPCTEKCPACGYRKVDKAKLTSFLQEIGKLLPLAAKSAKESIFGCLQSLDETPHTALEIVDDYVFCEKHAYL